MPMLGIMASSISGSLNASSYESIATTTVGSGGASSISFTSIPGTFKHLQIRLLARSTEVTGTQNVNMSINGGPGSTWHRFFGNGTSVGANAQISASVILGQISGSTSPSNVFATAVIDLMDYKETTKYKTSRALFGVDDNSTGGIIQLFSGLWQDLTATTTISLTAGAGFAQYTSAALYGIKG